MMSDPKRTPLVRASKLLWVPIAIGLATTFWMFGTPHLLWTYRYSGSHESKYYLSCDYLGRDSQTVEPRNGECPLIALLRPNQRRI